MFQLDVDLSKPGLFVTGTDTEVGKTVVSCAVAAILRERLGGGRVGVCKPFASDCRRDREGLVNEDAEALAHFADCRQPLDVINPIRYRPPLAPAVAAEESGEPVPWDRLSHALSRLDAEHDTLIVEGVGGLLVPLDPAGPGVTVLDLIRALGYPVVVVARSVLGTLNHTAMTVELLKRAGCRVAGVVMNGFDADAAAETDPSVATNRQWIARMTQVPVLAVAPRVPADSIKPHQGVLHPDVIGALRVVDWLSVTAPPRPVR